MEQSPKPNLPYVPIAKGSPEIRVLRVLPGGFEDEIRGIIEHKDIEKSHYAALSYVWGNPTITKTIKLRYNYVDLKAEEFPVEGPTNQPLDYIKSQRAVQLQTPNHGDFQDFEITRNLEAALRHMRHNSEELILWVDAICINQSDEDEKDHEILRMQEIYSGAGQVNIWLGKVREDCDPILPIIDSEGIRILNGEAIYKALQYIVSAYDTLRLDEGTFQQLNSLDAVLTFGIDCIFNRTWFERLWVLQEVALARGQIIAYIGQSQLSFNLLLKFIYVWFSRTSTTSRTVIGQSAFLFSCILITISGAEFLSQSPAIKTLSLLSQTSGRLHTSEAHDRLFGLLGLLGNVGQIPELSPTYKKPLNQFYWDLAKFLVEKTGNPSLLLYRNRRFVLEDLPSWVPTWDAPAHPSPSEDFINISRVKLSPCGLRLHVNSLYWGDVILVLSPSFQDLQTTRSFQQWLGGVCEKITDHQSTAAESFNILEMNNNLHSIMIEDMRYMLGWSGDTQDRVEKLLQFLILPQDKSTAHPQNDSVEEDIHEPTELLAPGEWENISEFVADHFYFFTSAGMVCKVLSDWISQEQLYKSRIELVPGCNYGLILQVDQHGYRIVERCYVGKFTWEDHEKQLEVFKSNLMAEITLV
jgi:hypothetical protein